MLWMQLMPMNWTLKSGEDGLSVMLCTFYCNLKNLGLPGGSVVKNLPASAGDMGLIPNPGRSHRPQSNWAHEQLLSPVLSEPGSHNYWAQGCKYGSLHSLEPVLLNGRSRCSTAREQPSLSTMREKPTQQRRSCTAKNKYILKIQNLNPKKEDNHSGAVWRQTPFPPHLSKTSDLQDGEEKSS